ncbi:MAG: phasin family protein [Pseudomonadota bacterium]
MTVAAQKATPPKAAKAAAKPKTAKAAANAGAGAEMFETVEELSATAREQFEKFMGDFQGNSEEIREQFEELNDAMQENFDRTRDYVADVSSELTEAARDEVTDAVQFANDIAKAKTLSDALEIQRNYWTNLFDTRVERARDLTNRSVDVARENIEPMTAKTPAMFDTKAFENLFRFPAKA